MNKLSIITICYNEPNLEKTCQSIVNQTWQDFEWVVIDGGSNKETLDIFEKYKYRINKFISEPDNGRYDAMNKGIKIADGEFLNFLNAGDYYFYNDALKDIFENKSYSSDILYGNECVITENLYSGDIWPMPDKITKDFLYLSTLRHQASFIKKNLFEKYGFYNDKMIIASDYEKWFEFLENGAIFERIPYTVTYFNLEGISCNKKVRDVGQKERLKIINEHFTKQELELLKKKYGNKYKMRYSFFELLFSIKKTNDGTSKILTFLGLHFYLKRKK